MLFVLCMHKKDFEGFELYPSPIHAIGHCIPILHNSIDDIFLAIFSGSRTILIIPEEKIIITWLVNNWCVMHELCKLCETQLHIDIKNLKGWRKKEENRVKF